MFSDMSDLAKVELRRNLSWHFLENRKCAKKFFKKLEIVFVFLSCRFLLIELKGIFRVGEYTTWIFEDFGKANGMFTGLYDIWRCGV